MCVCVCARANTHARTQTTHTNTRACANTHAHTHTHTPAATGSYAWIMVRRHPTDPPIRVVNGADSRNQPRPRTFTLRAMDLE